MLKQRCSFFLPLEPLAIVNSLLKALMTFYLRTLMVDFMPSAAFKRF